MGKVDHQNALHISKQIPNFDPSNILELRGRLKVWKFLPSFFRTLSSTWWGARDTLVGDQRTLSLG